MGKIFRRFGPHYSIERFGIIFLSLVLCMVVLLGSIVVRKIQLDKDYMSDQAVYTSNFAFSQTGATGTVQNVYVNEARTKCFLLLHMDSMTEIPVNADEYAMFLTGSTSSQTSEELKSAPNGSLYVFGSTGYVGVFLQVPSSFPSQILSLTIRSLNAFAGGEGEMMYDEESFKYYDQIRVFFNPGGLNARHAEFLDSESWTATDVYEELIAEPYEKSLRTTLRNDLITMVDQQHVMQEYEKRLAQLNMASAPTPPEIANDQIYAVDPADENMTHLSWDAEQGSWINEDGTKMYKNDAVWLFLDSGYLIPGGLDFQWQTGSVKEGYMETLTGSSSVADWEAFLDNLANADTESSFTTDVTWNYTDGREYVKGEDNAVANSQKDSIAENIELLTTAWQTYYDAKAAYQTEHLPALCQIEIDVLNAVNNCSVAVNDSDNALLTLY